MHRLKQRAAQPGRILLVAMQERIQLLQCAAFCHDAGFLMPTRAAHGFHLGLRLTQFMQQFQCARRLVLVDAAHGESDMHQHPFADIGFRLPPLRRYEADVDRPAHAANVDDREIAVGIGDLDDASWDA